MALRVDKVFFFREISVAGELAVIELRIQGLAVEEDSELQGVGLLLGLGCGASVHDLQIVSVLLEGLRCHTPP